MGLRDMAESRGPGSLFLDPDKIKEIPGYNGREMESEPTRAHIEKMVNCIVANGTEGFPPITVRLIGEDIFVVAGYCRRRAFSIAKAQGAPVKGILAIPESRKDEAELTLDLLSSNDGLPLTPLEKANVVKRLMAFQWTPAEIAKRRGVSVTAINDLVQLLEAPEPVQDMVRKGEVSARMATDVIRKEGADKAPETLQKALETAKEKGRERATPKHLPKKPEKETPARTEKTAPPQPQTRPVPKPETDWSTWGPKMKKLLEKIRDVESVAHLQQIQMDVGPFLAGMAKGGR